jgi:2-keto-4-pentenoate hydratase/2-oxohepta-3-ene-1,7-dioic acid hydratase in catechol pathway
MRLVTYESNGGWRPGIQIGEKVVNAVAAAEAAYILTDAGLISNRSIIQWTAEQQGQLEQSALKLADSVQAEVYRLDDVVLGPPIPDPDKIICLGLNYRSHAEESGLATFEVPILFAKYRNALTGPTSSIVLPGMSKEVDYEAELAVVMRKRCKNVSSGEALNYVAGYMALNDVSARDLQFRTSQWLSGKTLDTFAPCGPALVVNEISDPQKLNISTRLNGQIAQQSNTGYMISSAAETIAYISQLMTLEPGDIIATGTPEGVGFKRMPPVYLHDGDVVEIEIEGIGILRNPVVQGSLPDRN